MQPDNPMSREHLAKLREALGGVGLTEDELSYAVWLAGFDPKTVEGFAGLLRLARRIGQEDAATSTDSGPTAPPMAAGPVPNHKESK